MRNIRQNLFFAFVYNAAGVPIAAGVLYPVFGILLSPMIAAAAMALSSVSVIGNALRLRAVKLGTPSFVQLICFVRRPQPSFTARSRSAFATITETELRLMAAPAIIGLSRSPNTG